MIAPMLAQKAEVVPEADPNIVMEPKYDGWRGLLDKRKKDADATLHTREGKAIGNVPYIIQAFERLPANTTLDGEIVDLACDPDRQWNRTSSLLQKRSVHTPTAEDPALTYVLFDMLELNGTSLLMRPLRERRELLEALIGLMPEDAPVQISPQFPCDEEGFDRLVSEGWEGVVCKRLDTSYALGARNGAWIKVKPEQEVDVVCTGTFAPKPGSKYEGSAVGGFTFEVTHAEDPSPRHSAPLRVTGKCGTGMDDALRKDLLANEADYVGRVAVVGHAGIAPDTGALRFPALIRFRDPADKSATDVRSAINVTGTRATDLLERVLQAQEERDEWKERAEKAEARLAGAVKKAVSHGGARGSTGKRNYNSMSTEKLVGALSDLQAGRGDAHDWVTSRNGDPAAELRRAEEVARHRGMI